MEDIENEVSAKIIEKVSFEPAPAPELKPKKPRSEAQKAACEKASAKRMENLTAREDAELAKIDPDTLEVKVKPAPKKRGRPRGSTKAKKEAERNLPQPVNHPVYQPVNHEIPFNRNIPQNFYQYDPRALPPQLMPAPPPPPAPVNNYYYYGAPPPTAPLPPEKEIKAQPEEIIVSPPYPQSSSEESEEEYFEEPKPSLKFRFA